MTANRKMLFGWIIPMLVLCDLASALWSDFEIRSITDMNGTTGMPIYFNLRQKRMKKGVYGIAGTVVMNDALTDYTCNADVYHSASGNNVFTPTMLTLPRSPACDKADKEYRKYLMNDMHNTTDFPYTEDANEELCSKFKKGTTFTIKDFLWDSSVLPKFLPAGLYKLEITVRKGEDLVSGLQLLANLS